MLTIESVINLPVSSRIEYLCCAILWDDLVFFHPVKLEISRREMSYDDSFLEDEDLQEEYLETDADNKGKEFISADFDTVIFPEVKHLCVRRRLETHECKDYTQGDFKWERDTPDGITIWDLAEAIFRLKISKTKEEFGRFTKINFSAKTSKLTLLVKYELRSGI